MNRHLRTAVAAAAALTAGLLMTACQSGSDSATASGTSTTSAAGTATESPGSQESGGSERPAARQGSGADSSTGTGSAASTGTGSSTVSPSRGTAVEGIDKGEGVNGTWFGNVSYLAPGKYTVSGQRGSEQEFLLAEDTEIIGYDDICGDPSAAGGTKCTEAQLETAAKKGVSAEVVIKNGIATSIRDDH
ncbi:hypothetical protein EV284_5088 [Streptomyces sp. BK022]|uniref:hypothetical protein n=1 Tax=Streptomyces sp. BK022 TaxID=2512123 RepID=UPI001029DF41|nr:hypothetical protein [Streptomyces sp. BK022]RZU30132.1 hypothetical protein EV284_5088 [Streptomyces sp. BK022]